MKKRLVLLFFIVALSLINLLAFSPQAKIFIIATGPKGANYYKVGKFIASQYEKDTAGAFSSIQTNGSLDNIKMLKNNYADFAIVQRNVLLNSLYDEKNGINNVEVIAPLFEEKFRIYAHSSTPLSISKLKKRLLHKKQTFGFTSKTGYSYELFRTLANFLGFNTDSIKYEFSGFNKLLADFSAKKIDYVVNFSLSINQLEAMKGVNLVYFDEQDLSIIQNRIPNLFRANFNDNPKLLTLGSWTFLVGVKSRIRQIKGAQKLFTSLFNVPVPDKRISKLIHRSISAFKSNKKWKYKYMRGIPLLSTLNSEIGITQSNRLEKLINYGIILLIIMVASYFLFRNKYWKLNFITLWIRNKHIIIGILALIFFYFLSVRVLYIAEQNFYYQIGIKSQLLNFSDKQLNSWLLFRNLTGDDNGIVPLSTIGKLALSFNAYILWIGSILIALAEYVNYQIIKKRKKGLMDIKFKNHIVIIGWNDTTYDFIKNTVLTAKEDNGKSTKIVCIVPSPEEIIEKDRKIKELHALKRIHFVQGEARDTNTLERSNVHNADSVILLAEDSTRTSDEHTLLRALAISKFCRSKTIQNKRKDEKVNVTYELYETSEYIDSIYIIAEINDPGFKKHLLESDVNEVVITSSYGKSIITQSMFNHGVSKVMDELLQFNGFNEFYLVDLSDRKHKKLQNKTFDELLLPLRKQKILLIAIKLIYHDKHNNIIIDNNELKKRLEAEGLKRDVIVNPIEENEIARRTDADDQLIVFATNRKDLEKQLQQVVFE